MRAVIDTNLLVSAMISKPGSTSRRLLEAIRDGRLTLILSRPLIDEFLDVMRRPKFARYGITIGDVLDFIAGPLVLAAVVPITG
jgi:putative PIN family toxin of toxin-antitoxin system